jgi:hypothetical protein
MAAVAHWLTYIRLQRHGLLRHQAVTQSAQQWLPCSSYSMQEEPPCTTNDLEVTPVMSQSWCERLGGIGGPARAMIPRCIKHTHQQPHPSPEHLRPQHTHAWCRKLYSPAGD